MFDDLVAARYARWLRASGLAEDTIDARLGVIRRWHHWCGDPLDPARATPGALLDWLDARPRAAGTRYNLLSILRGFYRWARLDDELVDVVDPTERVPRLRAPSYLPRPVSETDIALVLAASEGRMRTIIGLAALAGLRVSEIARLRWDDIDMVAGTMRIFGKGRRTRIVPVSPALAAILDDVDRDRAHVVASHRRPDRGISPAHVGELVADHLRGLGIDATAHQLRHWFATQLYRTRRDLLLVAKVLGHQRTTTTQGYADIAAIDTAAAVAAMPVPGVEDLLGPAAVRARGWLVEDLEV